MLAIRHRKRINPAIQKRKNKSDDEALMEVGRKKPLAKKEIFEKEFQPAHVGVLGR